MNLLLFAASVLAVLLFAYLLVAILAPERFQ